MLFYLATGNEGKLKEFRQILGDGVTAVPVDVEENGSSFEANALIKARAARQLLHSDEPDVYYIADDSGLCINVLDGAPGIYSARYSVTGDRKAKVLREMQDKTDRKARFVCVIAAISGDGAEFTVCGECAGEITLEFKGENGFGYDPIFIPEGSERTLAEISAEEKNLISHRAKAILALKERLEL